MKKIYLTFDMDWASDDVLKWFCDEVFKLNIRGTLNVTNYSIVLDEIRNDGRLELGIHPNFNKLLFKQQEEGNIESIIADLKEIVPEAVSARSHSLVTGASINECFYKNGIRYELNYLYKPSSDMRLRCFKDYLGLIHVPFFWEDDDHLLTQTQNSILDYLDKYDAPLVFNFHPIHLFLNTENMQRYEAAKKYNHMYHQLKTYRNEAGTGINSMFYSLVMAAREKGYDFSKINEIQVEDS